MTAWPTADRAAVLDRVDARAREIHPGQVARRAVTATLALITNVLFCIGYVSAKALRFGWFSLAWGWAAIAEGFAEGFRARERGRTD